MIADILIKCFLIGILVSAPMGPVGMLCIQRTISRGRWSGFVSGLGAAASDLVYALITGLGLSLIINWIEANQHVLQLVGSVLMVFFGLIVFRTNPKNILRRNRAKKQSFAQDFVTSFLLTFANALIILYFIALFARFGFPHPDFPLWVDIAGYGAILLGAAAWWFGITSLVATLRKRFTLRTVLAINRSIGLLIVCLSVLGIAFALYELLF